jgi:hypothetical protein
VNNQLRIKIREEILADFHPLRHQVRVAFTEVDAFVEMAIDYYKCKQVIGYLNHKEKPELARAYEHLKNELAKELKEYLSKRGKL